MPRTVRPAWPATDPFAQLAASVPLLSQNCSFNMTKPSPARSIRVLGGGVHVDSSPSIAQTSVPSTFTPSNWVPSAFDEVPDAAAWLFDCDLTTRAETVHWPALRMQGTPPTSAKVEAALASVKVAPWLSLTDAPDVSIEPAGRAPLSAVGAATASRF